MRREPNQLRCITSTLKEPFWQHCGSQKLETCSSSKHHIAKKEAAATFCPLARAAFFSPSYGEPSSSSTCRTAPVQVLAEGQGMQESSRSQTSPPQRVPLLAQPCLLRGKLLPPSLRQPRLHRRGLRPHPSGRPSRQGALPAQPAGCRHHDRYANSSRFNVDYYSCRIASSFDHAFGNNGHSHRSR